MGHFIFSLGITSLGSYDFKLYTLSIRKVGVVFKKRSARGGEGGKKLKRINTKITIWQQRKRENCGEDILKSN